MAIRRKQIKDVVEGLLATHQIYQGPVPVEKIGRALGITITLDQVDDDLSGFLFRDHKAGRTVIGANKSHHPNRLRFTIAHELGHFLLHAGEVIHLDEEPASFTVDFRNGRSSKGEDDNEKEANLFAAELLMPAKFLRQELEGKHFDLLGNNKALEKLAKKYKVSLQALTFRLTNLGYIKL
jgi:Zn-dependent peptidase ImmA (M78 family)